MIFGKSDVFAYVAISISVKDLGRTVAAEVLSRAGSHVDVIAQS